VNEYSRRQVVQGAGAMGLALAAGCGRLGGPVQALPSQKLARIGWLIPGVPDSSSSLASEGLLDGLRDIGYVEGQHFVLERRSAEGQPARLPDLAAELVQLPVDVIVTVGPLTPTVVRDATTTIPIVAVFPGDPVASGAVASLARPGGNVTGLTQFVGQLTAKRLELLKETLPGVSRVAFVRDLNLPFTGSQGQSLGEAAQSIGIQLRLLEVRSVEELEAALDAAVRDGVEALLQGGDTFSRIHTTRVVALAARYQLPAMYWTTEFVTAGGLMAYAPNVLALYRRAATYVDRILKGTKPADLPVEQPMRFDFVINLKTAQALGLTIPHHVLLQATEVIQ
jgi:putative tryptophan/tyrosine transport system substrate-binding protein